MNVVGKTLTVSRSTDPTLQGRSGTVVLDTKNTLVLKEGQRTIVVAKSGSTFTLAGSAAELSTTEVEGRLQDRWGSKS